MGSQDVNSRIENPSARIINNDFSDLVDTKKIKLKNGTELFGVIQSFESKGTIDSIHTWKFLEIKNRNGYNDAKNNREDYLTIIPHVDILSIEVASNKKLPI